MNFSILSSAHIDSKNSILIKGGNESTTRIGCFSFLLNIDGEYILIDTGIESIETVNKTKKSVSCWQRDSGDSDIVSALETHGLTPCDIKKVFLTHSHYDHISGITHFKDATIYMSRAEYDFLNTDNPHKQYLSEQIDFLKNSDLVLFDNDCSLPCGVSATLVAGHTPGSVIYRVDDLLFSGDNIFLLKGIKKNRPIGFCLNEKEAERALGICRAHKGIVITSHDEECRKCLI